MTRVKAVCTPPCPWFLHASLNFDKAFQLKFMGPDHTCTREQRGLPLIHSGYLAKRYLNEFRINPSWPIKAFHKTAMKDFSISFKPHVLRRAKRKCLKIINGTDEERYGKLWDYKNELLKRNPNSTVEMQFMDGDGFVFRRLYICLAGLKHGFKLGCRKVVGFDGCHIKNHFKGQILTAVGVDPNNCMFPIAYAVVEAEKYDSWAWFIALFSEDFSMGTGEGWTVISDRQKGLIQVVEEMLPEAEHRYCERHMHNNFKQIHRGRSLKERLWACARATNEDSFTKCMGYIQFESVGAYEDGVSYLTKKNQITVRCGNCGVVGHNKRTCKNKGKAEGGTSAAAYNSDIENIDEEEMREAYHEAVMEMQMPEDAPPLTQPSQPEIELPPPPPPLPKGVLPAMVILDDDDTPLAVSVLKIKNRNLVKKAIVNEEVRRAAIKKEMADQIDAVKKNKGKGICMTEQSPRRSSRLNEKSDKVLVADQRMLHNAYTGAMKLGPPGPPPVKQYKTIVGGATLKSAPFQSHGKTVITKGALQAAAKLPVRRKLDAKK